MYFYAAVSHLLASARRHAASSDPLAYCLRALSGYREELQACGVPDLPASPASSWWREAMSGWERTVTVFLPIRALRSALRIQHDGMVVAFTAGLIEEDARFGTLFERLNALHGQLGQCRATTAVLAECDGNSDGSDLRAVLRVLTDCRLVRVVNSDAPRIQHAVEVPTDCWEALRGERHARPLPWLDYRPPAPVMAGNDPIVAAPLAAVLTNVPRLLTAGEARTVVIRGPLHSGRRTLLAAIARTLHLGVLEMAGSDSGQTGQVDQERWQRIALLATAMHAMPIVACEPGPGERVEIARPSWFDGPLGIAIGRSGSIAGSAAHGVVALTLEMPGPHARCEHWRRAFGSTGQDGHDIAGIAEGFRLPAGQIWRTATLARSQAALSGRVQVSVEDVREATRLMNAQAMDALAARVPCAGDWTHLAAREDTIRELVDLELRCRHRERLPSAPGPGADGSAACGVSALLRGPSGTGKTLAARLLASVLQKDLYRVDLSSIVNKYIGETEKNLDRVLSRAEELDVILLFDEGDALLTQRTGVSNANDRYANLETNFLLQRLESFDGILVVTTNAGERIDAAFERRMDVVVEFQPAQAAERWDLWQLHLPRGHAVADDFLNELASRCVLSGGQIRNVVQHASLQALPLGRDLDAALLEAAVRREYRKAGGVRPLRSVVSAYSV